MYYFNKLENYRVDQGACDGSTFDQKSNYDTVCKTGMTSDTPFEAASFASHLLRGGSIYRPIPIY